ncbi:MAG: ATP-binding protein [Candidatus Acidiferrales bacterium]
MVFGLCSLAAGNLEGERMRVGWQVRAIIPVAAVLIGGVLVFVWVSVAPAGPEAQHVILIAAAGAVAICGVMLVALVMVVQRPLRELQRKIAQLRTGDLAVAASFASRSDEIGDLGRNFNAMVRQLRESRSEIQRLHESQMSRAEHLATLGELAAGLAHEIRNPLAGIAGVVEIIGNDLPQGSPGREVWEEARAEIQRIQKTLNELLNYSRPKAPEFVTAPLHVAAERAVRLARQQAASRPIEIGFSSAANLPPVEHDAAQIEQMLLNLLLNAIQAIDGQGRIEVRLEPRECAAVVTVSDTGRGIPGDQLEKIFRPFFTTKGHGTGLGLSLARRIAETHGGGIEVTSVVKKGTTFTVSLPLKRAAPQAQSAAS